MPERYRFLLVGYVVMPEHVHLLGVSGEEEGREGGGELSGGFDIGEVGGV
jgi:hypothetical protein